MKKSRKPHNCGTWTKARLMGHIRSHLRKAQMYYLPMKACLEAARRPSQSRNKRLKWEFKCAHCRKWFDRKGVQIDHIEAAGSLRSFDDLQGFAERLFCEHPDGYQVLCKDECHKALTKREREERANAKK